MLLGPQWCLQLVRLFCFHAWVLLTSGFSPSQRDSHSRRLSFIPSEHLIAPLPKTKKKSPYSIKFPLFSPCESELDLPFLKRPFSISSFSSLSDLVEDKLPIRLFVSVSCLLLSSSSHCVVSTLEKRGTKKKEKRKKVFHFCPPKSLPIVVTHHVAHPPVSVRSCSGPVGSPLTVPAQWLKHTTADSRPLKTVIGSEPRASRWLPSRCGRRRGLPPVWRLWECASVSLYLPLPPVWYGTCWWRTSWRGNVSYKRLPAQRQAGGLEQCRRSQIFLFRLKREGLEAVSARPGFCLERRRSGQRPQPAESVRLVVGMFFFFLQREIEEGPNPVSKSSEGRVQNVRCCDSLSRPPRTQIFRYKKKRDARRLWFWDHF